MKYRFIIVAGLLFFIFQFSFSQTSNDPNIDWFDYSLYHDVLHEFVNNQGLVKYSELINENVDLNMFVRTFEDLSRVDYQQQSASDQIAFWINVYNSLVIKVVTDHYPLENLGVRNSLYPPVSIQQIPGVFDKMQFSVMGIMLTLNDIEHTVLRKDFDDPRIVFALAPGCKGCVPLSREPYHGKQLSLQLDLQCKRLLSDSRKFRIDFAQKSLLITPYFDWYSTDFTHWSKYPKPAEFEQLDWAVHIFLQQYLPEDTFVSIDFEQIDILLLDYDWSLNEWIIKD